MTKAFAYLRVSGKGQVEGDGFTRQETAIRGYAKTHDIRIMKVYRERGVSGTTDLENRPALGELIEALHSDGVKQVLIEKLDRLARDLMVQETILADLRKSGFEVVSVMEPDLCTNDPSRKLMRQIFGAISEYEKAMIVLKLRGARARCKAKEGKCEGRKPYGYRPGEDAVIERMKELRASGMAFEKIADALNAEGIKTRTGAPWHGVVVNRILTGKR